MLLFGFWDKGLEALQRRPFERLCYDSWEKYGGDRPRKVYSLEDLLRDVPAEDRKLLQFLSAPQLSDYARLFYLKKHGGIYLDVSVLLTEPLDNWLPPLLESYDVVGFHVNGPMWAMQDLLRTTRGAVLENWFLATKGSPALLIERWFEHFTALLRESLSEPFDLATSSQFGTKVVCQALTPENSSLWHQHRSKMPLFSAWYLTMHTAFVPAFAGLSDADQARVLFMREMRVWNPSIAKHVGSSKMVKFNRQGRKHIEDIGPESVRRLFEAHSSAPLPVAPMFQKLWFSMYLVLVAIFVALVAFRHDRKLALVLSALFGLLVCVVAVLLGLRLS